MIKDQKECKDHKLCDYGKFKRPRYFHGMLLEDKDFQTEQSYHLHKRRLLNRELHGWGVVCGLDLKGKKGESSIEVGPGLALDCCGREIQVYESYKVDLNALPCPEPPRSPKTPEECEELDKDPQPRLFYVAICYDEVASDPVPVYVPGEGCEERSCDYSRTREGFCIEFPERCCRHHPGPGLIQQFCECPPGQGKDPSLSDRYYNVDKPSAEESCEERILNWFCRKPLPCGQCPECCDGHHCVILGRIQVDECNRLEHIWINDCRTYVWTGRMVQYLITSTLSGLDCFYELAKEGDGVSQRQPMLDPNVLASNPIEALCWLMRKLLVEKWELEPTKKGQDCEITRQPERDRQAVTYEEFQSTIGSFTGSQDENLRRITEVETRTEGFKRQIETLNQLVQELGGTRDFILAEEHEKTVRQMNGKIGNLKKEINDLKRKVEGEPE